MQRCLVSEDVLKKCGATLIQLELVISEQEYKEYLQRKDFKMEEKKETMAKALREIRYFLGECNIDVSLEIDTIQDTILDPGKCPSNSLINEIETFASGVKKITCFPLKIALGLLDFTSALSSFSLRGQVIIAPICSLASKLLIYKFGQKDNMSLVVEEVLCKILKKFKNEELEDELIDLINKFTLTGTYLNSLIESFNKLKKPVPAGDIAIACGHVPLHLGTTFLVKLSRQIKDLVKTPNSEKFEEMRKLVDKILKYLNMYCYISILREIMLWKLYVFLICLNANQMHVDAILSVIEVVQRSPQEHLEFLKCPDSCSGFVIAFLDPDKNQLPCIFLEKRHVVQSSTITEKKVSLCCLCFPDHCIAKEQWNYALVRFVRKNLLTTVKPPSPEMTSFTFKQLQNGYYVIRLGDNMSKYVIQGENGYAMYSEKELGEEEEPDSEGQWKVIQIHLQETDTNKSDPNITQPSTGQRCKQSGEETDQEHDDCSILRENSCHKHHAYMLCTKKWPGKFIYMTNTPAGYIDSKYGNPSREGFWFFNEV